MRNNLDNVFRMPVVTPHTVLTALQAALGQAQRVNYVPGEQINVETVSGDTFTIRLNGDHSVHASLFRGLSLEGDAEIRRVDPKASLAFHHAEVAAARWVQEHGEIISARDLLNQQDVEVDGYDVFLHEWEAEPKRAS